MKVFYGNNRIVFITKIPLVTDAELTTYSVIPIPTWLLEKEQFVMIAPESPYVAVSKDRKNVTTFTNEKMTQCTQTNIFRIIL